MPVYELQPLAVDELRELCCRWFMTLGIAEPRAEAIAFVDQLSRANLTTIAQMPLMAAMLCQLHAAAPEERLPLGRTAIYRRFVDLLKDHQHSGPGGVTPHTEITLARFGPEAVAAAHRTLDRLHEGISFAAERQMSGASEPVVDLIEQTRITERPQRVPQHVWDPFVDQILSGSGLLVRRGGDVAFLHQTLKEYMAARRVVDDPNTDVITFHRYVTQGWKRNYPWSRALYAFLEFEPQEMKLFDPPRRTGSTWNPPEDSSYFGFLLDGWLEGHRHEQVLRFLRKQLKPARLCNADAVLSQSLMGSSIPTDITRIATEVVAGFLPHSFVNSRSHPWPDNDGVERTWFDHSDFQGQHFRRLAVLLANFGDHRGIEAMAGFVPDHRIDPHTRLMLCSCLLDLGDERGYPELRALTDTASGATPWLRVEAAKELVKHGEARPELTLDRLACDPELPMWARIEAAHFMATLEHQLGAERLAAFAEDEELRGWDKLQAARALEDLDDERSRPALVQVVEDHTADGRTRVMAATTLARVNDQRGVELLIRLAADPKVDDEHRIYASVELVHFGNIKGLSSAIQDSTLTTEAREQAARWLERFNQDGRLRFRPWESM